ncbi:MAG TPA: CaiB/BaiF CoA-transferase family protein [Dehalococcoidia bacterium]|jgi:CoA:oxalate CoA-transferase|nr:CaiB/BaiF CoA-transferase family protein [Dehalococcoidia bacterium]
MPGPLSDVIVLDLTWVLSGPYASMVLCDLGAEVVKVERPPWGDVARTTGPHVNGESAYFFSINRGKKSVAIDLQRPEGKELFLRLVEKVDVVMENFTPGTMDGLGLGYETLRQRNPRLIYAATSGFGQTGPDRLRPALDIVVQGMGGVMSITGEPGGRPVRPGLSLGDIAAGLFTAIGVLAALHERERSGQGQFVDVSMLDCQIAILENAIVRYFATGQIPGPLGTRHPAATPFQAFPTKDGYIVLALAWGVENQWELFCATIGRPELIGDERFETSALRTRNHAILEPILNEALRQRTTAEWIEEFDRIGLPCGPLNNIAQAVEQPQVRARDMLVELQHPRMGRPLTVPNTPVKLSRTPGGVRGLPPDVGEHTEEILTGWLGLTPDEVRRLEEAGVVVQATGEGLKLPPEVLS